MVVIQNIQANMGKWFKKHGKTFRIITIFIWIFIISYHIGVYIGTPPRCSETYTYKLGKVDTIWGFYLDKEDLKTIINNAESNWENALGENIFEYNPDSPNSIDFVINIDSDTPRRQLAITNHASYNNHGGKNNYSITVYNISLTYIFTTISDYPEFTTEELLNYYLEYILTHEFGHVIGLDHVDNEDSLMNVSNFTEPRRIFELNEFDVNLLKQFCD